MNRRHFLNRGGRWVAALPFIGAAAASPQAQVIEGEVVTVEQEVEPFVAYGPYLVDGVIAEGEHGIEYVLWMNNTQIATGPASEIVARGQQLATLMFGR